LSATVRLSLRAFHGITLVVSAYSSAIPAVARYAQDLGSHRTFDKANQADRRSSCTKDALAFESSGFRPEQPRALMPRQSYLHFECDAMSVMQYRNPNVSNRISADMPHSWQVT
jgi:hypothetical protein